MNTFGSFYCTCDSGYRLQTDDSMCIGTKCLHVVFHSDNRFKVNFEFIVFFSFAAFQREIECHYERRS